MNSGSFIDRFRRMRRSDLVASVLAVVIAVLYAGGKNGTSPPRTAAMPPVTTAMPVAADAGAAMPADFPPVTNLCFWSIVRGEDAVALGIAWPPSMAFASGFIDLYGGWNLASNLWTRLAQIDVSGVSSNAVVELPFSGFPTNAMEGTAFFRLASQDDADGDGLPDAYETWSLGTDPAIADTDGDGLPDGDETAMGTNPVSTDTDGDGLTDDREPGSIVRLDSFEWHDTTGLETFFRTGGYWHQGSGAFSSWVIYVWADVAIPSGYALLGVPMVMGRVIDTGCLSFLASDDYGGSGGVSSPRPLNEEMLDYWSFLVAPYWANTCLHSADTNSYIRCGVVSNGSYVVEFHGVRKSQDSPLALTCQVIVPPGTGDVVRVSYLASDWWLDGDGAVVGVQNKRIVTTNGYYNLTWDFAERGPLLPHTTIEFRFGRGSSPMLADTDGDGLADGFEVATSGTDPINADTDGDGLSDGEELVMGTDPAIADTDGDGLPDGWEVDNDLDPLSALGIDGASGDQDGDLLDNAAECRLGTNPHSADTDGDGLCDGEETVGVSFADPLPWLELHDATNATMALYNSEKGIVVDLPTTLVLQGEVVTSVTLGKRGMLLFNRPFYGRPDLLCSDWPLDRYALDPNCLAVVPYDGPFSLGYTPAGPSTVRVGTADHGGRGYVVVEYANVVFSTNSMSFQVAVPTGHVDRVGVRYAGCLGENFNGWRGNVGYQTFGGRELFAYCSHQPGKIYDGLAMSFVFGVGTDPVSADTDGDGLGDAFEVSSGTNPLLPDTDRDGLSDAVEVAVGTNPLQPDTDGDGMNDGWEHAYTGTGFDPIVNNATDSDPNNDLGADPDGDGLTNGQECAWSTNPHSADTDGDGVGDGVEIAQNSDPADADDGGVPNSRVAVSFFFGDHSGSHSEKYRLEVSPVPATGDAPRPFSWVNEEYGECETRTAMLRPGWRYEVRLFHAGTSGAVGLPDYDYTLQPVTSGLPAFVVLDDPDSLFGVDDTSDSFAGEGKAAYICVLAPPMIAAPSAVGVNNDDDNGNGIPDWEETGLVIGDDDLGEARVSVVCPQGMVGIVEVTPLVGATAGTVWKSRSRDQALETSEAFQASSGETTHTYFLEGANPSSRCGDEGIRAIFRCSSGLALTNEFRFTFVERIAEPITTMRSGGQIVNPCCAVIGGTTKLKVDVLPNDFPAERINWRVVSGPGSFTDAVGREAAFVASGDADEDVVVQVDVGDCPGRAPQFTMLTTTMHEVKIYPCAISRMGRPPPITASQINSMLDEVNVIYRQVGMHFALGAPMMCVTNDVWATDGLIDDGVGAQIRDIMSGTDGIEIYFITGKGGKTEPLGTQNSYGIIIRASASAKTIAHEIGHVCRWGDIYCKNGDNIDAGLYEGVNQNWMPADWSNGTGCRLYDPMLTQYQAIRRLLMYGKGSDVKCDIPLGAVHGRGDDGALGNVSVGRNTMLIMSPRSL